MRPAIKNPRQEGQAVPELVLPKDEAGVLSMLP